MGKFVQWKHRVIPILEYYSAVRNTEATRALRNQFRVLPDRILFDVGQRLKSRRRNITPAIPIPLDAPYVSELKDLIFDTAKDQRLFPWTTRTSYNIVRRVFKYPHWFRLSRITWFFQPHPEVNRPQGFSIAEVRSWTGLSLRALNFYVGIVGIESMGKALANKE